MIVARVQQDPDRDEPPGEPASVSVPPGQSVFKIKTDSKRAVEWEILKGVDVVEERENIIPGFVQTGLATLDAGQYQMTCGLRSNPKGVLLVAAADAPADGAKPAPVSQMDLVGPLAGYKVDVTTEVEGVVGETKLFVDAVKSGKLDEARKIYNRDAARSDCRQAEPRAGIAGPGEYRQGRCRARQV